MACLSVRMVSEAGVKFFLRIALSLALLGSEVSSTLAQNFGVSEFRAGFLAHSIDEPGPGGALLNLTRWQDVNFEALLHSPDIDAFRWLGSPKINIGATINLTGLENMAHLGLTWQARNILDTKFFVEGTFGAAVHDGLLSTATVPARNLGCRFLFYQSAALGMDITDNMSVMLAWEHASSAKVCMPNRGLTNVGVKIGYRF